VIERLLTSGRLSIRAHRERTCKGDRNCTCSKFNKINESSINDVTIKKKSPQVTLLTSKASNYSIDPLSYYGPWCHL